MINKRQDQGAISAEDMQFLTRIDRIRKDYLDDLNKLRHKYLIKFKRELYKHTKMVN